MPSTADSRVVTRSSPTPMMVSSRVNPARCAIEPSATSPITGFRPGTPFMNSTQKARIANRKLNPGPASSTATRASGGRLWKERPASSGASGPSRSSSILT